MRSEYGGAAGVKWTRCARSVVSVALPIVAILAFAACADAPTSTPASSSSPSMNRSEGRGLFQRYVALGSGMSMGWQSDGVTAESQYDSWPADLARIAHREMDQPYLATPTCFPPTLPPLVSFTRAPSGPCANAPGVSLPTQNVAMRGATVTSALKAMVADAASYDSGFGFSRVMPLVLPPNVTQVGAVQTLNPKVVSVEYGTSELLRGMLTPFPGVVRLIPSPPAWSALYDQILDAVSRSTDLVVLLLPPRPLAIPGFVSSQTLMGSLLSPQVQAEFNIAPPAQPCDLSVRHWVYAPLYLRLIVSEALAARAGGQGPVPINCNLLTSRTDLSFSEDALDFLASSADAMRAHIRAEAVRRGFAYFDVETLYTSFAQPSFNVSTFMNSTEPFGPYVSLDGIYPTAAGNRLLADAAARALNEVYALGLPVSASTERLAR